ncbi:hypothetical protein [Microcoleus sp. CAWBG58]|uniref:hypothetical protein n=1 Tax=Microcoleus sp. CAWBG58 TaxID=2841651 RepID=UPI0025D3D66A|nr:hypothetical protein [Microcoleus sp. CAWBG58]
MVISHWSLIIGYWSVLLLQRYERLNVKNEISQSVNVLNFQAIHFHTPIKQRPSVNPCLLPPVGCQLSTVNCQLSTVNCQLSLSEICPILFTMMQLQSLFPGTLVARVQASLK